MAAQVDIHCHLFNGDDLPVKGFTHRTKLHNVVLADRLAWLADRLVQGVAPGYEADLARVDALLSALEGLEVSRANLVQSPEAFEAEVDRVMAELQAENPETLTRIGAGLAAEEGEAAAGGPEGFRDVAAAARRGVRWVKLFSRSRLDLFADHMRTFGDELDLVTPLLVDLGTALGDAAVTTGEQQMALFEKISRASMQGVLPGGRAHVHPFVGFDPLRELRARRTGAIERPLEAVQKAVVRYGFVGVKVYPPMGWRPSGNTARTGLSEEAARQLDGIVDDFAAWCEAEEVPITAHCNRSNHAHPDYQGFGSPDEWLPVLEAHPGLHLNLGHFGGAEPRVPDDRWPWQIAEATARFEHLYADVGNHRVYDRRITNPYLDLLASMFADAATSTMATRIMYGSDWYMVALHPHSEQFLQTYRNLFEERFGGELTADFMGGNALRFLGFDDPANRNAKRLRARYQEHAPDRMPTWLPRDPRPGE